MTEHLQRGLRPDTLAIVAGRGAARPGDPLNVPVHLASNFRAHGDIGYAREGNPTWSAFEEVLGGLEGGQALVFASGMAAITAVLEELPVGAKVVAPNDAYTGTRGYLSDAAERTRLNVELVDIADTDSVLAACEDATLLWIESPTNPLLAIADIRSLVAGAHAAGAKVVVDNTFATPLGQLPLDLGADIVVHSATKFIAGHSDLLMGAAVVRDERLYEQLHLRRTLLGAAAGPMEVFLALRGLRTLPVRLAAAQASAGELARRLQSHAAVERVRYPGLPDDPGHARAAAQMHGFGAVLAFEVADAATADRVCAATEIIVNATSLGGVETTMERRRRYPEEGLTPEGLIRVSVGCENVDDLWDDLVRALGQA